MGEFIGGAGAAAIMAAAVVIIIKFLLEINVLKDKNAVRLYGKVSVCTLLIALAYMFTAAWIYNSSHGQTNFFAFEKIFSVLDVKTVAEQYNSPKADVVFGGMMMPFYSCLVHLIGKAVFEKYVLVSEFISVLSTCVSACMLYSMLLKRLGKEKTDNIMLIISSLPFIFMMFAPTYVSLTIMFVAAGCYALSKENMLSFLISAVFACATSKLGFVVIIPFVLYRSGKISAITQYAQKCKILNNEKALKILIAALLLISGAVMACLIKEAA